MGKSEILLKCVDNTAITQVLGCYILKPSLLKEYKLESEDIIQPFQKIIFMALYNLYRMKANNLRTEVILAYINKFQQQKEMCVSISSKEFLYKARAKSNVENIEYYFDIVKKYTLLRNLYREGVDIEEFFDPNFQNEETIRRFYLTPLMEMADHYRKKLLMITSKYIKGEERDSKKAGEGVYEMKDEWKEDKAWGLGYASAYLTTVAHGLRTKRFTITSAGTGGGKTRTAIANMVFSCAPYYYSKKKRCWVENPQGTDNRALYIGTEMELKSEIDPIILAYMADVPEEHITFSTYEGDEEDRVNKAIQILSEEAHIYLEYIPDYNADTLENIIEQHKIEHNITHVFFDYIHSTSELTNEYVVSAGGVKPRDDQVLSELSKKLKRMCRKYDVSIDTATQLSGDYKNIANRDETIVRGSKAIIDKADLAMIQTAPTKEELEKIQAIFDSTPSEFVTMKELIDPIWAADDLKSAKILDKNIGKMRPATIQERREFRLNTVIKDKESPAIIELYKPAKPNIVLSVYKNRGGRYSHIKIWLYIDFSTMRVHDLFVTDYDFKLFSPTVKDLKKTYIGTNEKGIREVSNEPFNSKPAPFLTEEELEAVEKLYKG